MLKFKPRQQLKHQKLHQALDQNSPNLVNFPHLTLADRQQKQPQQQQLPQLQRLHYPETPLGLTDPNPATTKDFNLLPSRL